MSAGETPTGRKPGEPNIQVLKPPVTPDVQQMVDDIKAAMAEVVGFPDYREPVKEKVSEKQKIHNTLLDLLYPAKRAVTILPENEK